MMSVKDFADELVDLINRGEKDRYEVRETVKNNGESHIGITKQNPGIGVPSPIVYIDDRFYTDYNEGMSLLEIAREVVDTISESSIEGFSFSVDFLNDFEQVKDSLFVRLRNEDANPDIEVSEHAFADVCLVPYIKVDVPGAGSGTIKISKAMLERWGKTEEEVMKVAKANSAEDFRIMPMPFPGADSMLGISNNEMVNGASAICAEEVQEEVADRLGGSFVILPSSVHEVICVPDSGDDFSAMVREINATVLKPEDFLTDVVLKYDVDAGKIVEYSAA